MAVIISKKFTLNKIEIDNTSQVITDFTKSFLEEKKALKLRLIIEELLNKISNEFKSEVHCELTIEKKFTNGVITLTYDQKPYNPLLDEDEEFSNQLFKKIGLNPIYENKDNKNIIIFNIEKK